jgi:plastocyanin
VRRPVAALALCAAVLAACGNDDESDSPDARTITVGSGETLRVVADEYSFDPSRVVVDGAGRRATLTVTLDNQGALAHNLKLFDGGRDVGGTPTFPGGRTESGGVSLAPGRYRMVCTVANHEELGMIGSLEVR